MKQREKSVIVAECRNFDYNVTRFAFGEGKDKIKWVYASISIMLFIGFNIISELWQGL